jgi:hypothetical protein
MKFTSGGAAGWRRLGGVGLQLGDRAVGGHQINAERQRDAAVRAHAHAFTVKLGRGRARACRSGRRVEPVLGLEVRPVGVGDVRELGGRTGSGGERLDAATPPEQAPSNRQVSITEARVAMRLIPCSQRFVPVKLPPEP